MKKSKPLTMYIANRRDSSKFKGYSPLQLYLSLIGLKPAIAYLPYTHRYRAFSFQSNQIPTFAIGQTLGICIAR